MRSSINFSISLGFSLALSFATAALAQDNVWQSEMDSAKVAMLKGTPADAYLHYGKALDAATSFKADDPRQLQTFMAMAKFNFDGKEHLAEADNFYNKALAFVEAQPKFSQLELARIVFPLIMTYVKEEKYAEAKELFEKGKAVDDQLLTSKDPDAAAAIEETSKELNNLAVFYLNQKQNAQGELVLNEALPLRPNYKTAYTNRALARREQANAKGADEDSQKASELAHVPAKP